MLSCASRGRLRATNSPPPVKHWPGGDSSKFLYAEAPVAEPLFQLLRAAGVAQYRNTWLDTFQILFGHTFQIIAGDRQHALTESTAILQIAAENTVVIVLFGLTGR